MGEKGERTVTELIYRHLLFPSAQQEGVKLFVNINEKRWNVFVGYVELFELVVHGYVFEKGICLCQT